MTKEITQESSEASILKKGSFFKVREIKACIYDKSEND